MRTKIAAVTVVALLIALSLAFFAEARPETGTVEASGILEEKKVAVSIPAELALLGADTSKGAKPSSSKNRVLKPVGAIEVMHLGLGDTVKRGTALFTVSGAQARENLKKAQAQYDFIRATIDSLDSQSSDLAAKRRDLNTTEADVRSKRVQAVREFNAKMSEGEAKIAQVREKLASVTTGLQRAQAGLAAASQAAQRAGKMLETAQALPDSDSTKAQRIQEASGMLEGATKQQIVLGTTIKQLSAATSQLQAGIAKGEQGLKQGKQQFSQGLGKIDTALAKIAEGRQNIKEGISKISKKEIVLKKRRDQAEVGVALARKILAATAVKAGAPGLVKDLKITEGSVVFPGQKVMSVVRTDTLELDIFIPPRSTGNVAKGDRVEVMVDAEPGRIFKGTIVGIGGKAEFAPANLTSNELELVRVVRVMVEVANEDGILKAGMPADVIIEQR